MVDYCLKCARESYKNYHSEYDIDGNIICGYCCSKLDSSLKNHSQRIRLDSDIGSRLDISYGECKICKKRHLPILDFTDSDIYSGVEICLECIKKGFDNFNNISSERKLHVKVGDMIRITSTFLYREETGKLVSCKGKEAEVESVYVLDEAICEDLNLERKYWNSIAVDAKIEGYEKSVLFFYDNFKVIVTA